MPKQIQWFPGHMAKAKRLVEEKLPLVDIVFELIDARIPNASENPMFDEVIKNKPRLLIMNKSDLADDHETNQWLKYYENLGINAIAISSTKGQALDEIVKRSKSLLVNVFEKEKQKGLKSRPIRAMVIGIPNVGKSQFINMLCKKNKVKTGDKPGVTKTQVYLKASSELEVLDNPGILWPKIESHQEQIFLSLLGSIKEDILPLDDICIEGIKFLKEYYFSNLCSVYRLDITKDTNEVDILYLIGKNRGCLLKQGEIDLDRVYKLFLYDFRNMAFGKMTLERVHKNV